ncbi:hypothetical protein F5Y18DRAFT_304777 [Xylariaceae sp. FL1019]|nr:hypothetical protein F5Y18DRAFT_304777 [Xylariaceae sp. FL1019]
MLPFLANGLVSAIVAAVGGAAVVGAVLNACNNALVLRSDRSVLAVGCEHIVIGVASCMHGTFKIEILNVEFIVCEEGRVKCSIVVKQVRIVVACERCVIVSAAAKLLVARHDGKVVLGIDACEGIVARLVAHWDLGHVLAESSVRGSKGVRGDGTVVTSIEAIERQIGVDGILVHVQVKVRLVVLVRENLTTPVRVADARLSTSRSARSAGALTRIVRGRKSRDFAVRTYSRMTVGVHDRSVVRQ